MKSKYDSFKENEWITPEQKEHNLACCDCGLVHTIDYRIVWDSEEPFDPYIQFRVKRNERATGQRRRHLYPGIKYLQKCSKNKKDKNFLRIDLKKVHEIITKIT